MLLSLVEDGWRSARVLSLAAAQRGQHPVLHLVKGEVAPDVLRMITPYPGTRIQPIARRWFRVVSWCMVLLGLVRQRWHAIVVDNHRTYAWVQTLARWQGVPVVLACEAFHELTYEWESASLSLEAALRRLGNGKAA